MGVAQEERSAEEQARAIAEAVEGVIGLAYLVGGSVRDLLMERSCVDYDFATPLTPDEVETRVRGAGKRPHLVGKRFGTVGFSVEGRVIEVTTFRSQRYMPGSRGPRVRYLADLGEDLAQRDFTVNAMALRGGALIDPHGGAADVAGRTVRAVGNADERFAEDPLRVLRAARFASQLGFAVEPATAEAMRRAAPSILDAARERWVTELDKLLVGETPAASLRLLAEAGVLRFVLPELQLQVGYDQRTPWHDRTLFEHTTAVVEAAPRDAVSRWAALLHDAGKPYATDDAARGSFPHHAEIGAEIVTRTALYLRWSAARHEAVRQLVLHHMEAASPLRAADDSAKTLRAHLDRDQIPAKDPGIR